MAKDLFRPGDPADLNPPITLPSFGERPASGISLRRTNARAPRESIDDLLAALPDVPAAAPATPASKGWGQTLLEGVTKGVETAGLGMTAQTGRDPAAVASQLQDTQIPRSSEEQAFDQQTADAAKAFDDADGFTAKFKAGLGILGVMARNPKQAAGTVAQSLGMSAPAFAAAGGGAAVGSLFGPVGTAVGAFTGYVLGNFATNIQAETAQKVEQELQARGVNTNDPAAVERAIASDPAFFDIVREYGLKKGVATGAVETAVDLATAGVAGKANRLIRAGETALSRGARGTAAAGGALAAQGVSEGLGSAAGQAAVGEDVSWGQALTEGAYGALAGAPDAAIAWKAGSALSGAQAPDPAPADGAPVPPQPPAGGPLGPPGPEARFVGRVPPGPDVTYTPPLTGPAGRPAIGKDPAQPADWEVVDDSQRPPPGGGQRPALGYDQRALPGPDGTPPALERPESVGPGFVVDAEGNARPATPEGRMADQARAGDMRRPEAWLEGAVGRMGAQDAAERARLGLTPDVQRAQESRTEPWREQVQPGDTLFDGKRPFMFRTSAEAMARKTGGEVIPVPGGFVVRPKAVDDFQRRLNTPEVADELRAMAKEAGWAQVGGRMTRKQGEDGTVLSETIGRTTWIPNADWWAGMQNRLPGDTSGRKTAAAVEKAFAGERLSAAERRLLDEMTRIAERELEIRSGVRDEFGNRPEDYDASLPDATAAPAADPYDAAEREALIAEAEMALEDLEDAAFDALLAAAYTEGGLDDAEIDAALPDAPAGVAPDAAAAGPEPARAGGAEGAQRAGPDEGGDGRGESQGSDRTGAEAFALKGQTPEEVKQQEAQRRAAEEADRKRAAAPPADEFRLTGSDSAVDQARAAGQMELDAAPAPAAETKPAPSEPKATAAEPAGDLFGDAEPRALERPKKVKAPGPNARPLYAARKVLPETAQKLVEWAHRNGFKSTLKPEDLHVTIAYSRDPVDPAQVEADENGKVLRVEGGWRRIEPLGDKGAIVLKFGNGALERRWQQYRDAGASWDWPAYTAHITITYDGAGVDLSKVKRFVGPIELGPEYTTDLDPDAADKAEEQPAPSLTKRAEKAVKGAPRRGEVGGKLGWGEVVLTVTGRETTPFPKPGLDTNRKATATVARVDRWLMENALAEAEARGDDFAARQFRANLERPSQADKDGAEEYLFGGPPAPVPRPFLKPLVERAEKAIAPSAEEKGGLTDEQKAAIEKHGLPANTAFTPGMGTLGRGKMMALADGESSNLHETADAAAAELRRFLDMAERRKGNEAARDQFSHVAAEKIRRGEQPTDAEWAAIIPGFEPGHRYARQPAISPFLTGYLGVSKARIRASIGKAAGTLTSDSGAEYPIVYHKRLVDVFGPASTEQKAATPPAENAAPTEGERDGQEGQGQGRRKALLKGAEGALKQTPPRKPKKPKESPPDDGWPFETRPPVKRSPAELNRRNLRGSLFGSRRVANPSRDQDDALYDLRSALGRQAAAAGLDQSVLDGLGAATIPFRARPIAKALRSLFGVEVYFIDGAGSLPPQLAFNGIYVGGRRVFIASDSERPFHRVIGHEFLHWLKQSNPDLFAQFAKKAAPLMKARASAEMARARSAEYEGFGYDSALVAEQGWEEVYADVFGDAWADPDFWRDLIRALQPKLAQSLVGRWRMFWLRVQLKLAGLAAGLESANPIAEQLLKDAAAVRAVIAETMAEQAGANAPSAGSGTPSRSAANSASPWYSELARQIGGIAAKAQPASGWLAAIKGLVNAGKVKADEVEWSGVEDYLALQQGKVTKEQLRAFVETEGVQLGETMLDTTKEPSQDAMAGLTEAAPDLVAKLQSMGISVEMDDTDVDEYNPPQLLFNVPGELAEDGYGGALVADEIGDTEAGALAQALEARWATIKSRYTFDPDGGPKYDSYAIPGGKGYRELLITLPRPDKPGPDGQLLYRAPFHSQHWDEPNVLAHVRMDTRMDADGKRVLFVNEIQSDWAQRGRETGFDGPPKGPRGWVSLNDPKSDGSTPSGPFVTNTDKWVALAIKRIIRYAAETGHDRVAFATGEQISDALRMTRQVKKVVYEPRKDGTYKVTFYGDGMAYLMSEVADGPRLEQLVGREIAGRIQRGEGQREKGYTEDGWFISDTFGWHNTRSGAEAERQQMIANPTYGWSADGTREWKDDRDIARSRLVLREKDGGWMVQEDVLGHDQLNAPPTALTEVDLTTGGEGNREFYGKIIPKVARDVLRRLGGDGLTTAAIRGQDKVGKAMDDGAGGIVQATVPGDVAMQNVGFDITPALRARAMRGLPMFARREPMVRRSARTPPAKQAQAERARMKRLGQLGSVQAAVKAWFDRHTKVLGGLPEREFYLEQRYLAQGRIGEADKIAAGIRKAFADATPRDKQQLYAFLTTRGVPVTVIEREALRKVAADTKHNIRVVGNALVRAGLMKPETMAANQDAYLPRLYLAHLLDDGDWRAIGAGKKPSDMGYLKKRQDIPEDVRRVILGEIKDPAYLSAMAIVRPMRDIALLGFLEQIAGREGLVLPKSIVEWDGKKVTPLWLKTEADKLRNQARYMEDRGDAKKAVALADRMDAVADPIMDELNVGDYRDWKKLPDSPRYGRLRGLHVQKDVYEDIVGVYDLMPEDLKWYEPQSIVGYGGVGTRVTQWWKVGKVTLNPGSQVRNVISNFVMLQLSGVSLHMVVPRIVQAIKEIADDGPHWKIAQRYGVTEASFVSRELPEIKRDAIRLQLETMGEHPLKRMGLLATLLGATVVEKASDVHQAMEYIGKTAKIIDAMSKGATEAQAALEAQDWLFDYSLVPRSVRYLRNQPVAGSPFLCVDDQTQALTKDGWRGIDELVEGDLIAGYDMKTGKLRWRPVNWIYRKEYEGKMLSVKDRHLDMMLTPDHRCVTLRKARVPGNRKQNLKQLVPQIVLSQDLNTSDNIPVAADFDGLPQTPIYTDGFVKVVGWFVTEGCRHTHCDQALIAQNTRKAQMVRDALTEAGMTWREQLTTKEAHNGRKGSFKANYDKITFSVHAKHGKTIYAALGNKKSLTPEFVTRLTLDQLGLLIETMIDGDGCRSGSTVSFVQKTGMTADSFKMALTLAGRSYGVHVRPDGIEQITLRQGRTYSLKRTPRKWVQYAGRIWCPQVDELTTWVARRNGKVFVTGNTWMYKAAPRLLEVAALHPQRLLPWFGLVLSMPILASMALGGDADDWDEMKRLLPEWARKKGHLQALPFRDSAGRIQFIDLGPYLPWTMWTDFLYNAPSEPAKATMDLLGSIFSWGPVGSAGVAISTGVDPFTDRKIVPEGEPPLRQAAAWASYFWSLAMPPIITSAGTFGKVDQALTGNTNRYGDPRATLGQAAATLFGANVYGINPDTNAAQEMSKLNKAMTDTKIRMLQRLQDRGLSDEKRQEIVKEYADEITRRAQELQAYAERASKVPKELKVDMEPAVP